MCYSVYPPQNFVIILIAIKLFAQDFIASGTPRFSLCLGFVARGQGGYIHFSSYV